MDKKIKSVLQKLGKKEQEPEPDLRGYEPKFEYSDEYNLVTQLKSWTAINPAYGCIWDCGYCIQEKDEFFSGMGKKVVQKATADDVVTEIMTNPRIKSSSPLALFNFSDPFLPQNTTMLQDILTQLDERRFTNPIGLITRTYTGAETLDVIANLEHLRPVVFVSYAGYTNKALENAPNSRRIQLIKDLDERDIKNILYLRPLVQEWMEDGQIERVRDEVGEHIDGVVMSGMRLTPEIANKLKSKGIPVPKSKNFTNKYFPVELQQEVIDTFDGVAPVFRYTSCGMSALLGIPDYNAHLGFLKSTQDEKYYPCPLPCSGAQQNTLCDLAKIPDDRKVRELINVVSPDTNYHISNGVIVLDKKLPKKDITFIRHNTNTHVDYENHDHHVDQIAGVEIKNDIETK